MSKIPSKHITKLIILSFKSFSLVSQQVYKNLQTGLQNELNIRIYSHVLNQSIEKTFFLAKCKRTKLILEKTSKQYIIELPGARFSPSSKNKNKSSKKSSYIFRKWNFLTLTLKNFLYFRKQTPQEKSLYFLKRQIFLYFRKQKP